MATLTVLPNWGRSCIDGRPRRQAECHAVWFWPTENTKRGFSRRSNRCAVVAASGSTQRLIPTPRTRGVRKSNWNCECTVERAKWKLRTNRRLVSSFRFRLPIVVRVRSASLPTRSEIWSSPWGMTSMRGHQPHGQQVSDAGNHHIEPNRPRCRLGISPFPIV